MLTSTAQSWRNRTAANPKIGELVGARQRPAERPSGAGFLGRWSAGGLNGDGVAEGFELADVVVLAALGVDALGVVAGAEVLEAGTGVREQVPGDECDTRSHMLRVNLADWRASMS
jgi:hypothetical protein